MAILPRTLSRRAASLLEALPLPKVRGGAAPIAAATGRSAPEAQWVALAGAAALEA